MGAETNVIIGYGVVAALFAYFGFELMRMPVTTDGDGNPVDGLPQYLGRLFFLLSIVFLVVITYTVMLIGEANGLSYLTSSVLVPVSMIMMYLISAGLGLLIIVTVIQIVLWLYHFVERSVLGKRRGGIE